MKNLILLVLLLFYTNASFATQTKSCASSSTDFCDFPNFNLPSQNWKIFKQEEIDVSNKMIMTLNLSRPVAVEFSNKFYGQLNVALRKPHTYSEGSNLQYLVIFSGSPYNNTSERRANWLDTTTIDILEELGLPHTRDQLLKNGLFIDFRNTENITTYLNRLEAKIQHLELNP